MTVFCFSSKQLKILTFVFYSFIGKTLDCPKALLPLAASGNFWHLVRDDVSKNMVTVLKATTFPSSQKASVGAGKYVPGMNQALRKPITAGQRILSTV